MSDYVVSSGETSSGIILKNASMTVLDGGTVSGTSITDGSYVTNSSSSGSSAASISGLFPPASSGTNPTPGAAETSSPAFWGHLTVSSGGKATRTEINCGGSMTVSSGAWANLTTVNADGLLHVSNGGSANSTTVHASGRMDVFSGGSTNNTKVSSAGNMYIYSGATVNTTNVYSAGMMYVFSGGSAKNTIVFSSGSMHVSGGDAFKTTISASGSMFVSSGNATSTSVNAGGFLYVCADATADVTTVKGKGNVYVSSGGTANDITVSAGGNVHVLNGGTATDIAWTPCVGHVYVEEGGLATFVSEYSGVYYGSNYKLLSNAAVMDDTTIDSACEMVVMNDGTANGATVISGGNLLVSSGGTVNGAIVNTNGTLSLEAGGTANSATLNHNGYIYVSNGAVANGITVSGGYLYVESGGTATDIIWTPCAGQVYVLEGGHATFAGEFSGVYYGSANQLVSNAAVLDDTTVGSACEMIVMHDGTANRATVNSRGELHVSSGGTANGATVNSGGEMHVFGGGTANSAAVNSDGTLYLHEGAMANDLTISGGMCIVSNGATANSAAVNSEGEMHVSSGATANGATVNFGGRLHVSSGGTANDTTNNGSFVIESGVTANNTTNNDVFLIESGATANNTLNGGSMNVSGGGTANDVTVSGGTVYITAESSGMATIGSGIYAGTKYAYLSIFSGGTVNNASVTIGYIYVSSGATANSVTVIGNGRLNVYSGGTANGVTVKNFFAAAHGATVNSVTVLPGASMYVSSGGTPKDITVSGGKCIVSSGGTADGISLSGGFTIYYMGGPRLVGAELYISSGGTANNITANNMGYIYVSGGGTVNNATVDPGGILFISSGGTATNVVWTPCEGAVEIEQGGYVTFAGEYSGVYIGSAYQLLSHALDMDDMSVGSGYKTYVMNGGTAEGVTVAAGGSMYVFSGGRLTGRMEFDPKASVSAYDGSILDFDLTETSPGGAALVNDLSAVHGAPTYTVTVDAVPSTGAYLLAAGADSFTGTITVVDGEGDRLGTLSLWTPVEIAGVSYALSLNAGELVLSVGSDSPVANVTSGAVLDQTEPLNVSKGEIFDHVLVKCMLNVMDGGEVNSAMTVPLIVLTVSSGGTANDASVDFYASMFVSSGGTANGVTVSPAGSMFVSSGGKLTGRMRFESKAIVSAFQGSILDFDLTGATAGGAALVDDFSVIRGTPTYTLTVDADMAAGVYLLAGGAESFAGTITVVNTAGARLGEISLGTPVEIAGVSYTLSLFTGDLSLAVGCEPPQSDAVVSGGGVVSSGVSADVKAGEIYYRTVVGSGGNLNILKDGEAKRAVVSSGGSATVSSGGTANFVSLDQGYLTVVSGGMANDTILDGGHFIVSSGAEVNGILFHGGTLDFASGGIANDVTIRAFYNASVSGGIVNGLTVSRGGLTVSGGCTANDVTIIADASLNVSSGGTVSSATFELGGTLNVSDGGRANGVTVIDRGTMNVSSGGTANRAMVDSAGRLKVYSGGTATRTMIVSGGSMEVHDGGTADGTMVTFGGTMRILGGNTATGIVENGGCVNVDYRAEATFASNTFSGLVLSNASATVHSGTTANGVVIDDRGNLTVFSGGTAADIVWTPCTGRVTIEEGGYATFVSEYSGVYYGSDLQLLSHATILDDMTIGSNCEMYVLSGGTATNARLYSNGSVIVSNGGAVNCAAIHGGKFTLFSGCEANSVTVGDNGYFYLSGGTANGITANYAGNVRILSGATATGIMFTSYGTLDVYSGGTANGVTLNTYSYLYVMGGVINNVTINNGGWNSVYLGGAANGVTVNSGGGMIVSDDGTANSITVSSGGCMVVSDSGTASNITLAPNGTLSVSSGGTALNVAWTPCEGQIFIQDGGFATFISEYSGVYFGSDCALLSNAAAMNGMTVGSACEMNVLTGGTAHSAAVDSGGRMVVYSGGAANGATINGGGSMVVHNGGTANSATVNGGSMNVYSGATANGATVNGKFAVYSGATANSATVNGGLLTVSSGGTASDIVWTPCVGRVDVKDGGVATFASEYSGVYYGSSNQLLSHAATMDFMTVDPSCDMYVMNGGTVNSASVNGGSMYVSSGGTANGVTLNTGRLTIVGGTVNDLVFNGGDLAISSGGTVNNFRLSSRNFFTLGVSDGGTINNVMHSQFSLNVNVSSGGKVSYVSASAPGQNVNVYEGGLADHITLSNHASMYISSGGTANNVTILNGGSIIIESGGVVDGVTVTSFGSFIISSGMSINDARVGEMGSLFVSSGGTANRTSVEGGYFFISSGAVVNSTLIHSGGGLSISSGITVNYTTIGSRGGMTVDIGGVANGVTVSSGGSLDLWGGTANSTTVSSGGSYFVGGTANDVTVSSGGTLTFYNGKLTGEITLLEGASVSVYYGVSGVIDFDLTQASGGTRVLVNDLSIIQGTPLYTITENCDLKPGNYVFSLAGGAADFSGTLSVVNADGDTLGTLSVGETVRAGYCDYTLHLADSLLSVSVTALEREPVVVPDLPPEVIDVAADVTDPTNGNVTVTASFADDMQVAESLYRIGGTGQWLAYENGVTVTENTTVYFKAVDTAGQESEIVSYEVSNIDRTAPVIALAGDNQTPLRSSTLTATVDGASDVYYSKDYLSWKRYEGEITVGANGTYYFIAADEAGNETTAEYVFGNIDTTAPVIILTGDNQTPHYSCVLTAAADDGSPVFYRVGKSDWIEYTGAIEVTANATYYFKSTDAVGNTGTNQIKFKNIDTTAPVITLSGDTETVLRQTTLTASVDDGSAIVYSTDEVTWQDYTGPITVMANGTYYFKATDAAGNGATKQIEFTNIDSVPPVAPVVSADVSEFTNGDVTVTAVFSEDSVKKEYTLDGETWQDYPEGGVVIIINGTVGFRGTDAVGNVSEVASYAVENIDKTAPATPVGLAASLDGQTVTLSWAAGTDDLSGVKEYVVTYSHDGQEFTANTTGTSYVIENADFATWQWSVKAVDAVGNVSAVANGEAFTVEEPVVVFTAKFDVDGNGISDVMFVWTGNNYQHGYWMNGAPEWRSENGGHPTEWDNLGCHDMTGDGKADSVMVGNLVVNDVKGAYIGYYVDAIDTPDGSTWVNIGYLNNADDIGWKNAVGDLTGNVSGANSIVWFAPELYALGAWTDGTDNWVTLSNSFGGDDWTLVGCGDFDGDGKDSVVMSGANGTYFYAANIDGTATSMGNANWSGWDVRAIGDFAGDGKDDLVLFHKEYGSMVMLADGNLDSFESIGQLDANDWFVVGAGDYNGDEHDDLLVRQYSNGMLGYYNGGDTTQWVELGRGVDMNWTVIA